MTRAFKIAYYVLTCIALSIGIVVGYNQLRIWQTNGQSYMSELVRLVLISVFAGCVVVGGIFNFLAYRLKGKSQTATGQPQGGSGQGKPAWQKLQWANAERERLEGEVRKLKEEIENKREFDKLADEDSAEMSKRLVLYGKAATLNVETVEPYIDVTFKIVNTSVFSIISEKVEGNAFYRGYSREKCYFSRTPIIADSLNLFTLSRGSPGELTLRQFVPLEITDNIAAAKDRLEVDFSEVRVHFQFPGTGGRTRFCWFGDIVEVGGLAVSTETLSKLGIIPKPSGLTRAKPEITLRGRVRILADEMLNFLTERDCESEWEIDLPTDSPPALLPLPALQGLSVADHARLTGHKIGAAVSAEQKTMDAIHYGYERQFKSRLSDLLLELKEHGIGDFELERNANAFPLGRYYCSNIRKIAERLLVVWSRMRS
jgi:hypothetical protein